ncbi:hypothetical protein O0L34_g318 [Tuta absoluta]|nr:hypothetical protein O0L34_g318 [Tuta absoluta]
MTNVVYLQAYTSQEYFLNYSIIKIPLVSLITYSAYKCCRPENLTLQFVPTADTEGIDTVELNYVDQLEFIDDAEIPWQAATCVYPVVLCEDTVITGLCAVARHISKYRTTSISTHEHEEGLLGFRKGCLQAPNEVSIWTKFCEVDIMKTVLEVLQAEKLDEIPKNIVRFENHLNKPVRVHNVYKLAREMKKLNLKSKIEESNQNTESNKENEDKPREPKTRKWKSNIKKELEINSSTKIEDLDLHHQFAEGPFLTIADLVLLPSYHLLIQTIGISVFESMLPLTCKWYKNLMQLSEFEIVSAIMNGVKIRSVLTENVTIPNTEDVSLYKCDPKRHNPKRKLFTKEDDIENALNTLSDHMELNVSPNEFEKGIDWKKIPDGANPSAGHLPDVRMARKSQQLENLALAVLDIAKDGDRIVDFCSGSGHLGILIAHLLPKCTVILLENKEHSLLRARKRVHDMGLKNVYFFQCNLDFFTGTFDIGIALHACGIASDLVLDKCLKANAKFVLCPCCYGSLHATDRLIYPRSSMFRNVTIDEYLCIGHTADQTHEEHPLKVRGDRCMAVIDSDRGRLAEEFGYKVTLSRLKPLTCTPKNNLLVGVPQ